MNRRDAARALGLSRAQLAKLEREGVAHPTLNERRVPQYTAAEVDRLRGVIATQPVQAAPSPRSRSAGRRASPPAAPTAATVPARALLVKSPETIELIDEAEQLEVAARVAEARRRLAQVEGQEMALQLELDELRARENARAMRDQTEAHRSAWRTQRISEVLGSHHASLVYSSYPVPQVQHALLVAGAVLASMCDAELAGANFPTWTAMNTICDVLRLPPVPAPPMPVLAPSPYGPVPIGWRPLQPGD